MADTRLCSIQNSSKRKRSPNGAPMRFVKEVLRTNEDNCITWPFARDPRGYGRIRHEGRSQVASRLVCREAHGEPPAGYEAAHSCNNGHLGCVNPKHLSWKTSLDNSADMLAAGHSTRGERHGNAKITEETARRILALKGTMLQREIAVLVGVERRHVNRIHTGKRWGWLAHDSERNP